MFSPKFSRRAAVPAALSCSFLACSAAAWADDTITITATRTPLKVDEVLADISVIDRAQIERAAGRTLVELLSRLPGLQASSTGGLGKTAAVFIRGLELRHTLLLVDGVQVSSATVGAPSLDNLPLDAIERIEVVRGPMSSLYGSNAMGGVIQVFTRRGRPGVHPNAKLTAGADRYGQLSGGVSFGAAGFDGAVQLQRTRNHGFSAANERVQFGNFNADDDGFEQNAGTVRLGWQAGPNWRLEAFALKSEGETQYDDGPGTDARAKLSNELVSLQASGRVADGWQTRLAFSRGRDGYDTLSSASPFSSLGVIATVQRQASWEHTFATPLGTALALVERIEQEVSRPGDRFTQSDRTIDALAFGLNGSAAGHAWQGSVRSDRNSQFGRQTKGAVAYGYQFTPAWRLGASYGTSFVAPSFNQLYYPGFGNPDLQPESGRHAELSMRWSARGHALRAAYFDNRYTGFITGGQRPVNVPKARIDGLTIGYEGRVGAWKLDASIDHTDPRTETSGSNQGKQLPRRARQSFKAGADWSGSGVTLGGNFAAYTRRFDDGANTLRLAGYATLDLYAEWAWTADWALGARLNNVADKRYETAFGFNQPGREAFVTLRWTPK